MRKTLLIAAAALAAAVTPSQAQVYSQNVVGYINQVIPAGGYSILGASLINGSDASATNMDPNVLFGNGLISTPYPPGTSTNSTMLYWNGSTYITYTYYNTNDATIWLGDSPFDPAGWYTHSGDQLTGLFTNGAACFIKNNALVAMTNTMVGTVFQNTNVIFKINPGYNLVALTVPAVNTNGMVVDQNDNQISYGLPTGLTSRGSGSNPNGSVQDELLLWNGSTYITYYYYNTTDATSWLGDSPYDPSGFYTSAGDLAPVPAVNQGFFIHHIGSAVTWTNTFSVQ